MKVLVLAGGLPQLELIKRLRSRFEGVEVILADYLEHPAAEHFADKFYRISTLDVSAIEKLAVSENVDFLITVCTDQALNTVAEVSERLGLPCYIDSETGRNVTNKRYMKQVFSQDRIPSAKHVIVDTPIKTIPEDLNYPLVVKPVDCNSSKGVIRVTNDIELASAVENAIEYSRTRNAIIEEYIEGKEVSVDAYVHNGRAQVLCISESEKIQSEEKFVIFRTIRPAGISAEATKQVSVIAQKITDSFGLKNCPMLIQMLYRDGQLFVVEFSARTGGGLKYQLIQEVAGVDIIDAAISATIGQSKPLKVKFSEKYIVNEFMYCHDGIFDHVEGFQELQDEGVIENYFVFKNPGTHMDRIASSGDRIASITVIADSFDELDSKHKLALSRVAVRDINGNDILHHGITYPLSYRELEENSD